MSSKKQDDEGSIRIVFAALVIAIITILVFLMPTPKEVQAPVLLDVERPHLVERVFAAQERTADVEPEPTHTVHAFVTGYNTVPEQTDSTPCIAASGDNICGRTDVVACPSVYPLGTEVMIDGNVYVCLDRTAEKFDGRFDISCDKDMECPHEVVGHKDVHIINK